MEGLGKMNYFRARKRRGLSSIVGTLFFIAIMVAAFTAILAAFSYQNDLIDTQRTIADLEIAKSQESFIVKGELDVASVTCAPTLPYNGCLKVTVYNRGTNPVEVDQLWLIQKAAPYDATPYNQGSTPPLMFQDLVIPISTSKDITSNSIEIDVNQLYSIKVVSKLGTIVTADVPDTCPQCQQGEEGLQCWDLNENGVGDDPLLPPIVINGVTYDTEDTDGDGFFTAIDCQGQTGNQGEEVIIELGFVNRPELFMVFPSPFGDAGSSASILTNVGLWEAVIANPTDVPMYVSKVVISLTAAPASTTDKIFQASGSNVCSPTKISPASGTFACSSENQLAWKKTPATSGELIAARSSLTFSATVNTGTMQCPDAEAFAVAMTVFTTKGQFGKTGYMSSARCIEAPHANLYLTDTTDTNLAILDAHMLGAKTVTTEVEDYYYVALADLNAYQTSNYINANTKVTINVPPDFTVTHFEDLTQTGWQNLDTDTLNDGSTVLTADLVSNLGAIAEREAKVLQFQATHQPENPITAAKLYVFYITSDGESTPGPFQVGPLAEIVVKVNP